MAGGGKGNLCVLSLDTVSQAKGYWLIFYHRVMTLAGEQLVDLWMKSLVMLVTGLCFQEDEHTNKKLRISLSCFFLYLSFSKSSA